PRPRRTLLPYTTLFRSGRARRRAHEQQGGVVRIALHPQAGSVVVAVELRRVPPRRVRVPERLRRARESSSPASRRRSGTRTRRRSEEHTSELQSPCNLV